MAPATQTSRALPNGGAHHLSLDVDVSLLVLDDSVSQAEYQTHMVAAHRLLEKNRQQRIPSTPSGTRALRLLAVPSPSTEDDDGRPDETM